jgi:hypothetical protein
VAGGLLFYGGGGGLGLDMPSRGWAGQGA